MRHGEVPADPQSVPTFGHVHRRAFTPFFLVFGSLCVVNAGVLFACSVNQSLCLAAFPFNWPAWFVLPDEADELLGIERVVTISWFVALPWLAVVSAFIVKAFNTLRS